MEQDLKFERSGYLAHRMQEVFEGMLAGTDRPAFSVSDVIGGVILFAGIEIGEAIKRAPSLGGTGHIDAYTQAFRRTILAVAAEGEHSEDADGDRS